jgi:hypothetical protein
MYQRYAKEAIKYVRETLEIKAANREWDRNDRQDLDGKINAARAEVGTVMETFVGSPTPIQYLRKEIECYARWKAGNCNEMAKIAFVYLVDTEIKCRIEIAELSVVSRTIRITGTKDYEEVSADHSLVIIGRKIEQTEQYARSNNNEISLPSYDTWNFNTVICDPWAKRAYLKHMLPVEMQMINRVSAGSIKFSSEIWCQNGITERTGWLD